jgi:hypothetical protein
MANAGWLPQQRPETFRHGYVPEDERPLARFVEALRPDEGFLGLIIVLLLAGIMGWSIADARWILGRDELTSFLIWVALGGAAWGWASSRMNISPWLAQVLGAIVATFVILELTGMRMPNATPGLAGWAQAAAYSASQAYIDLTWRHQTSTFQFGHFCIILGILVWGTAQAATYDIFGYRRAVNGVLLLAVVFVANMSLTLHDQFAALVTFCAAALVLLILSHAADERSNWLAHRIWRGHDLRAPNMQGGIAFASMALAGALVLTTVASSAPLASAAGQFDLANTLSWLNGYLPAGGQSRVQPAARFGSTFTISPTFAASDQPEFTVHVSTGNVSFHWRVYAYDQFDGVEWKVGPTQTTPIIAGTALDQGTADFVGAGTPGRDAVSITYHIQDTGIKNLITANEPDNVNVGVTRDAVGSADSSMDTAAWSISATDYVVSTYVPNIDPAGAGLTEWQLEHAGSVYPPGLLERFTQGTDTLGKQAKALLTDIEAWAKANGNPFDNAYDVSKAVQDYLRSPDNFKYNPNITDLMPRCTGLSTVDCFALIRQGFCQQYATTMTMLVRMAGYPARFINGFLPGKVAENTFIQQVTLQQAHAWVEVFFPGFGWIPFDPTGGPGQPTILPAGEAVAPTPTPTIGPSASAELAGPTPSSNGGGGTTTPAQDGGSAAPILIPLAFLIVIGLLAFTVWRRRPRRPDPPETVFRRVVWLASRLGYRPRPTQTVYEYAGMLARVVPTARDSLGVVATATVEVQYGNRQLSGPELSVLAKAQGIVERALLKLFIRLPRFLRRSRDGGQGRSG